MVGGLNKYMQNKNIITLANELPKLGNLTGAKFAYAIAKNLDIATREAKQLSEAMKPTKEFEEYDKKRIELAKNHSKKNDQGEPMTAPNIVRDEKGNTMVRGERFIIEDEKSFDKEFEKLRKDNKEILEARDKQEEDYAKFLEEESKIEFHKFDQDIIPENISVEQMAIITNLIN